MASLREWAETYDVRKTEDDRWIGDDNIAELGRRGLMGLYVPEEYGGQGLSQMGYCRVSEVFAQIDATLSVIMGVHQSIGMKGIVLFGTDEQKARFLPDLCSGEKLAGFALTEPEAGSDVHGMHTRAEREADGSWRLNGHKHYIGNGDKGSVFVTFAATGRPPHRVHRREGHGGLRGRQALRHDGPARQRPARAVLQRRARAARERARRARRRLQDRHAHPQQRAHEPRHRAPWAGRRSCSTGSSTT